MAMAWLTVLVSLPPTPSRHRVGMWRRLRRLGAVSLGGAAWLLPDTPATLERMQWLVQEAQAAGGQATLLRVERIETMREAEITALFHAARAPEYEAVMRGARALLTQLDRQGAAGRDAVRRRLESLTRELARVEAIDHLGSPLGRRTRALVDSVAARLQAAPPARSRRRGAPPPRGSTWVTRPRPHVDRVASAWLIRRFIDPDARFAFADEADAARKGVPFDVLGAEFGHHGDECTFETLLRRFRPRDRRLRALAEIVHEADLGDGKFVRPEAAGVDLAVRALAEAIADDHELLERGITLFDGLHALARRTR